MKCQLCTHHRICESRAFFINNIFEEVELCGLRLYFGQNYQASFFFDCVFSKIAYFVLAKAKNNEAHGYFSNRKIDEQKGLISLLHTKLLQLSMFGAYIHNLRRP